MRRIRVTFSDVTPDRRIQVIIVAWLFGSFIEGSAGFGTPAAVAVPLLVELGFPPLGAVMAGMIIQSTPVSFGAAGTPILLGISTGLSADALIGEFAAGRGYAEWTDFLAMIGFKVALLHAVAGTLIPLFVVTLMTRFFGKNRSFAEGLVVWRFALFAALAMTVPYLIVAWLLGPEFPSMLGGLIGLAFWVCVAAAEIAVLDLLGKLAGKSIGELLGGVRHRNVAVYRTSGNRGNRPEEEVDSLRKLIAEIAR